MTTDLTSDLRRKLVVFTCFLVTALTLMPVVMMVLVAFQSDAESMAAKPSFWPSSWHPENLTRAFDLVPLGKYLLNTVYFAAGTTILETVTAALAAYVVISNSDATRTASVGLQVLQDTNGTQWNLLLMAATVTTIPLIVLFFLTQRWFVRGITMSGLGGR